MPRPAKQLVLDAVPQADHGRVLGQMAQLDRLGLRVLAAVALDPGVAQVRHEGRVLLDVARGLVVRAVRDLPAVVRHQQERVQEQAHDVVELAALAERPVPALVRQDPDPREHEALDHRVGRPCDAAGVLVRDVLDVGRDVDEDGDVEVVAEDVGHGAQRRRLEAVRRDRVVDHLHGVGRQLEDVAVLINVLLLGGRGRGGGCWSHGGEMARRWLRGEERVENSQSLRCGGRYGFINGGLVVGDGRGETQRSTLIHQHGECAAGTSYSADIPLGTWVQYTSRLQVSRPQSQTRPITFKIGTC